MRDYCIAVTGLPGSGKSTVGRTVARSLDCAYLDKDDFLEQLFDQRGTGDIWTLTVQEYLESSRWKRFS